MKNIDDFEHWALNLPGIKDMSGGAEKAGIGAAEIVKGMTEAVRKADAKEADINKVISRIISGGGARVNSAPAVFADVSQFSGLQDALIMVSEAQEGFMSLDADVRERFDNDPVKLVAFLEDASNREEAVNADLLNRAIVTGKQIGRAHV